MAITGTSARLNRLSGLTPTQAGGKATASVGILGTLAGETLTVSDPDVDGKQTILATIQSGPVGVSLICATPGTRQIVFKLENVGSGNSTAGTIIIGYIGV